MWGLDSLIKIGDPEIHLSSDLSTYYTNFIMGNLGVKLLYSLFKLYQKMIVLKPAVVDYLMLMLIQRMFQNRRNPRNMTALMYKTWRNWEIREKVLKSDMYQVWFVFF